MRQGFDGRVALVTGASSGIGHALAARLSRAGAAVGLVARREAELRALEKAIREGGGRAVAVPADVRDRGDVERAVGRVRERLGPIDLVIASAGVGMPTLLDPVNVEDVEAMFRINVMGVVHVFSAVMPDMIARRSGHLAAVSSLAGYLALPGESAYCASKAAVNAYLAGLRGHLRGTGVRVTTLCPGFVRTAMTAANAFWMPGLMSADEAARRMLKAIERGRSVYDFPVSATLLTRVVALLPERIAAGLMAGYNEEAAAQAARPERSRIGSSATADADDVHR
jgi:short-subunit dehydrogenase